MESRIREITPLVLFLLTIISCLSGCRQSDPKDSLFFIPGTRSGDIICRYGNGFYSRYFREYGDEAKTYSHIGILDVSLDSIFVVHAEASELTGVGCVKREPLAMFLEGVDLWTVFRYDTTDLVRQKILSEAQTYTDRQAPFDLEFDLSDDQKVYCSQLVALSINKALRGDTIKPNLQLRNKPFFGLSDIYAHPKMRIVASSDATVN